MGKKQVVLLAKGTAIAGIIATVAFFALKWAPVWVPAVATLGPIGWVATAVVGVGLICALAMIGMAGSKKTPTFADYCIDLFEKDAQSHKKANSLPRILHAPIFTIGRPFAALSVKLNGSHESHKKDAKKYFDNLELEKKDTVIEQIKQKTKTNERLQTQVINFLTPPKQETDEERIARIEAMHFTKKDE